MFVQNKGVRCMSILVKDCFHWIGFHIVDQLLIDGYEVKGIQTSSSKKTAHLSMFFDRHSHFSLIEDETACETDTALLINQHTTDGINASRFMMIGEHVDIEALTADQIAIQQPLLFGEWMPIYEDGCYYLNDHIPFDSPRFHEQAIYIHDFTKMIVALLKQDNLPNVINMQTVKNDSILGLTLDNTYHIQDNTPIENKLQDVLKHHKQFKHYY